ncbi:DnaJ family domain-containing protein [Paenibacillus harenae]|uniref:DnaJ homologue subfamily C member 28 conserved domain-containing protein n=1 Tax=Paenibacillus harenae TaxID=306543 RepID=A0ABT9U0Q5_PAEHA|nr:DnaJ family domain-containing protein [Paenibacillus harenae]MDQ0113209.1 hypothetical protein [Paenibacillus harenae]
MDILRMLAEEKIREAIRKGEFDNLPGAGKPLPPDDMDSVPEELRVGYKLLKNAGMLPEEMQLRKEMITLGDLISACQNDTERKKLQGQLSAKKLRYQTLMSERGWNSSEAFADYQRQIIQKLLEKD